MRLHDHLFLKMVFADLAGLGMIRFDRLKSENLMKNCLWYLKTKSLYWWLRKKKGELALHYYCLGKEDLVAGSKKSCL